MASKENGGQRAGSATPEPAPLELLCGNLQFTTAVGDDLRSLGFRIHCASSIKVVPDVPCGWALHTLQRLRTGQELQFVVVTWNPSMEHLRELERFQPHVLVSGELLGPNLAVALKDIIPRVVRDERYELVLRGPALLTEKEEVMLGYLARGYSAEEIAAALELAEHSVSNRITTILSKLGVNGRVAAALHFWGIGQLFEDVPQRSAV